MVEATHVDGRRERSRKTRARLVEAAAELFLAEGYLGVTIEALAERAGVSAQTVYYVFGTKPKILEAVLEATIAGDLDPVPVVERAWVDEIREAPDADTAIQLLVDGSVSIVARAAPIFAVVQNASADPEIRALLDETKQRRRADQRHLIEVLAEAGHLRAGTSIDEAAEEFYALVNEEVFLLQTVDCAWTEERFRRWLTSLVHFQLTSTEYGGR